MCVVGASVLARVCLPEGTHVCVKVDVPWPRHVHEFLRYIHLGMKTDRIRMDTTDITFVFIFLFGIEFEYG